MSAEALAAELAGTAAVLGGGPSLAAAGESAASVAPAPRPGEPGHDELAAEFGWVDPPPGCVRSCGGLLRCCGRHPQQKPAFVTRNLAREAAAAVPPSTSSPSTVSALLLRLLCCERRLEQSHVSAGSVAPGAAPGAPANISALYASVEGIAHGYAALRCNAGRGVVSLRSLSAYAAMCTYLAFTMFYIILWARYEGDATTQSLLRAWGANLAVTFLLVEPLWMLFRVLVVVALWPLVVPWVAWIPGGVGSALAGPHAHDTSACGRALSG
jgi:hypothetical protein